MPGKRSGVPVAEHLLLPLAAIHDPCRTLGISYKQDSNSQLIQLPTTVLYIGSNTTLPFHLAV